MSDRCCITLVSTRDGVQRFSELVDDPPGGDTVYSAAYPMVIRAWFQGVGDGGANELLVLGCNGGFTFAAFASPGDNYNARISAGFGGDCRGIECLNDASPVVCVNRDGTIGLPQLESAMKTLELLAKVEKELVGGEKIVF